MWKDSFCIGIKEIDEQHKVLFDKVEELINEIRKGTVCKETCISTIVFLKDYSISHFADEEAYQRSINYPDYPKHKALHEQFLKTVLEHEATMVACDFELTSMKHFAGMLGAWLLYHVADEDQKITSLAVPVDNLSTYDEMAFFSVKDALHKLAGFDIDSMKVIESHNDCFKESVTVRVGLVGDERGEVVISFPHILTKSLIFNMLGFTPDYIGELEMSALKEIANIVSGSICGQLVSNKNCFLDIMPPEIVERDTNGNLDIDTGKGIIEISVEI